MTTVAPRFFASASAATAIFFAASSVSTFFTGRSGFAAMGNNNNTATVRKVIRLICFISRSHTKLLTRRDQFGVPHASRVSGERVLAIANFSPKHSFLTRRKFNGRLFRRDAETNTRDACATQTFLLHNSSSLE